MKSQYHDFLRSQSLVPGPAWIQRDGQQIYASIHASLIGRKLGSDSETVQTIAKPPTLCFIGPLVGRNPGRVTTQDLILADLFAEAGYQVVSASSLLNRYARLLDIIRTIIKFRRVIDIVHLSIYSGRSFIIEDIASFICSYFQLPLIMTLHGGDIPKFMARFPGWAHRVFKRASRITAPSQYLIEAVKKYGYYAQLIPNVLVIEQYPYRLRNRIRPRLFWMRSFDKIYNPTMAIKVLAGIRRNHADANLVMGGPDLGSLAPTMRLARELGVETNVEFPGFLNLAGKTSYGNATDIFINTTHVDNMPVAVVEACAMGLPIVSTNIGGIPYLLTNEETGLLVPDGNVEAMVQAIQRLLNTPELVNRLSVNGRILAEKSSWKNIFLQWKTLHTAVMKEHKK